MTDAADANSGRRSLLRKHLSSLQRDLDLAEAVCRRSDRLAGTLARREVRIRSAPRTAAACVLMACRLEGAPIRVTTVAGETAASSQAVLNEMHRTSAELDLAVPNADPAAIIEDACRDLGLPEDVASRATCVAEIGADAGVAGGVSPFTYAAASLYVAGAATDADLSQAEIGAQFDVSTETLRERRDDLLEAVGGDLFDRQFPAAPSAASSLVDDLLRASRRGDWTANKRKIGVVAGAWLYAADRHGVETSAAAVADATGVAASTVRARYREFEEHADVTRADGEPA